MRRSGPFLFAIAILFSCRALAQESLVDDVNPALLQKYIDAAKENYPHVKVLKERELSAKSAIPNNALSYLDPLNATFIYRPNSGTAIASPGVNSNPYSVNGFQFGVSMNIGQFVEKTATGKKARADYNATKYETQEYLSTLELEVRRRYYAYISAIRQIKVLKQQVADAGILAERNRAKFEQNLILIEVYTAAQANFTAATSAELRAEADMLLAHDSLEEIVGQKLSDFETKK